MTTPSDDTDFPASGAPTVTGPHAESAPATPARAVASEGFVVVSHEALFARDDESKCDVCGAPIALGDDDDHRIRGEGVYMWTRGEQVCFERAPLCADCGAAIGMTALARWEIEEEEG
jgi:hypothetical protein